MKFHVDFTVLVYILALAILLGALNNLRVAEDHTVKISYATEDHVGFETTKVAPQ